MNCVVLSLCLKNKFKAVAASILFLWAIFATSCVTVGKKNCPYELMCTSVLPSEGNSYECSVVDYVFCNLSDKFVSGFTIVFYLYDDDGNPVGLGSNCIRTVFNEVVSPHSEISGFIKLDDSFSDDIEVPYSLEMVHVSEINYADGSAWHDLFGMYAF